MVVNVAVVCFVDECYVDVDLMDRLARESNLTERGLQNRLKMAWERYEVYGFEAYRL